MTQAPATAPGPAAPPASAPSSPAAGRARPWYRDPAWYQAYGVYVAVGVLLLFNALFTDRFLTTGNLTTQLVQVAPVVIVALGMALVIGTEGVDLSVGSAMALAAALLPLYLGHGLVPALVLALLAGAVTGLVNGVLVSVVGLQPIVATLALFVGGRGLALVLADGRLKQIINPDLLSLGTASLLGVPVVVLVAAGLALAVAFLVARTTFGRQIVAVGGNREAAVLAGLPVKRVLTGVYVLCGTFAALAGVLATARLTASDPSSLGTLMELSAITAVVVGGTPLSGGSVRVLGTVAGAVLMQLLRATLVKHDLPDSTAQIAQAAIIVAAVHIARERRSR
ncbi:MULTISPECIES: ABC transporter permease [Streptomyces]|uniref:Sugar ABC transporter permease n=5 Tax=Streptomyces TaxID=1883 RepID=A0A6A0CLU1_9ACTN|nr:MULTISPECIES: ABC transporter permease [Streptomyces]NEE30743.1 ABC transporter permease [Streptomyces sp. SID7982]NEE51775.1 ABC transporter permease [Streptomyces sp. SID8455]MBL3804583.1 ABC transporter permease [Streptomyces sp. BRB081]PJM83324.1 ATPase [Streptomyces sp. TSRI0384-2]QNE83059.1 ABC transporter permease [Streptomyces rutgersensis]